MPNAPKRGCRKTGCRNLVDKGYCDDHRQAESSRRERWRGSSASRGYDGDWKRIRIVVLKRDRYLCQTCLRAERVTPADDVDHIIPIRVAAERRLDETNLEAICRPCHRVKTEEDCKRLSTMTKLKHTPPPGLIVHCDKCNLVVPSDAPAHVPDADCEFVAKHKLAWFNPNETVPGQHVMAVAAWGLIHDVAMKAAHPDAAAYYRKFQLQRKEHFAESAASKAMTSEQVEAAKVHRRDGSLYKDEVA